MNRTDGIAILAGLRRRNALALCAQVHRGYYWRAAPRVELYANKGSLSREFFVSIIYVYVDSSKSNSIRGVQFRRLPRTNQSRNGQNVTA